MSSPKVSVIVPAHNVAEFIGDAIDSLLAQTFADFEIIVVDDASTDNTVDVVAGLGDPRVRLLSHSTNSGVAAARNSAIENAKGALLAFLDSDDAAFPDRLMMQVRAFEQDDRLQMLGGQVGLMSESGRRLRHTWRRPTDPTETAIGLLFRNTLTTSTIMLRRSAVPDEGFRAYPVSEDYDFNVRVAREGTIANLKRQVSWYRLRSGGLTGSIGDKMKLYDRRVMREYLGEWRIEPTEEELDVNQQIGYRQLESSREFLDAAESWLHKLSEFNRIHKKFDSTEFDRVCGSEWFEVCNLASPLGPYAFKRFVSSRFGARFSPRGSRFVKFAIKSVLRHRRRAVARTRVTP